MSSSQEFGHLKREWENMYQSLEAIEADCWSRLKEASLSSRHEFHLPIVATISEGVPSLRTVVLRRVWTEEKRLAFHTDIRSPKVKQLLSNPAISMLFYSRNDRLQLRVQGLATVQQDGPEAAFAWDNSTGFSRRCYLSVQAPGTLSDEPTIGFPEAFRLRQPSTEETLPAREHFAVVIIGVQKMDWVWLHHAGHRRAQFIYEDNGLRACWLVP